MSLNWLWIGFAVFIVWISVRAMNREKAARNRVKATRARVSTSHGIEDVFVSPEDDSLVGLSADGVRVVLGKGAETRVFATADIRAIEGVRDGAVLVRAEPGGDPVTPAPQQSVADLPDRIGKLTLQVTTADADYAVLFFDGGRHGVTAANEPFRAQAAEAETWFRKLSNAMRLAR